MKPFAYIKNRYRYSTVLLKRLVITDFKLRYKGSVLGYLWSMLRPLFLFLVLYIVFVHFLRIKDQSPDPAVYLLLGVLTWSFFAEVTTRSVDSIVARGSILRKINFPKYIIVMSVAMSAVINLVLSMIVVVFFMCFGDAQPKIEALVMVPLLFFELFVFALGIGFLLSSIYMRFRDVNYVWEVVLQAGFYATPILYPVSLVAEKSELAAKIILLNPVAQVIQDIRYFVVGQNTITTGSIFRNDLYTLVPVIVSVGVFLIGAWVFRKRSKNFAEEL